MECIDVAGYAFQYTYDSGVNIRQMNTPQGVWNFLYTGRNPDTGAGRTSVTVVDPLHQRKKYEWEGHYAITTDWRGKETRLYAQTLTDTSASDPLIAYNGSESAIKEVVAPTGE